MGAMTSRRNTAVVIHEMPLMRLGIARCLALAGVDVAGETTQLDDGIDQAYELDATVLVVGDASAADGQEIIRNEYPPDRIVLLLRQASRTDLESMVDASVGGMARRVIAPEALVDLFVRVCAGEQVVEPELLPLLLGTAPPPAARPRPARVDLTPRERQVLDLLAGGAINRHIAERLSLNPAVVKAEVTHIFNKFGVTNRRDAVARAMALELVPRRPSLG